MTLEDSSVVTQLIEEKYESFGNNRICFRGCEVRDTHSGMIKSRQDKALQEAEKNRGNALLKTVKMLEKRYSIENHL